MPSRFRTSKFRSLVRTTLCTIALFAVAGSGSAGASWGKLEYSNLKWAPLDLSAGAKNPKFAKLWGTSNGPVAILVTMPNGFSSGPLVRSSDYRAIVISGLVTNDAPTQASPVKMPPGSFYVQPGGGVHTTAWNSDSGCLIYMEFDGRIDTLAADQTGPSPAGLQATRILSKDIPWSQVPNTYGNVSLAWVWGERETPAPSGFFLKFKAGFPGFSHTHTNSYEGLVVQGSPKHWEIGEQNVPVTPVGSTFWQTGGAPHDDACDAGEDCVMYFRMHGKFDIQPYPLPKN